MLLHDLTIENYRSFAKYKLSNLARVNLLVGDNNCGKTSVLEAVALYGSANPIVEFRRIAGRRSEFVPSASERSPGRETATVANFFFGRTVQPDQIFSVACRDKFIAKIETSNSRKSHSNETDADPYDQRLFLHVEARQFAFPPIQHAEIEPGGGFVLNSGTGYFGSPQSPKKRPLSIEYVGPEAGATNDTRSRWDRIILGGLKNRVLDAMRLLHPEAIDINYLAGSDPRISKSQIVLSLEGDPSPWHFGTLGEGSRRVFAIATALAACQPGVALLDEIDTGLHYSRMASIWHLVIKTAAELDAQVFATTHSLDCVRALAEAVGREPDLTNDVAIFRIERANDNDEAVRFGGEELQVVVDHEIEVR